MLALLVAAVPGEADAQVWDRLTNQRSDIRITHAPQVVLKGITKVAVLEFTGADRCGPELTERVTSELGRSNRYELIDRSSIDAVLREQNFQSSGAVSPAAAVKIGALVGPAAVFTGRITRCNLEPSALLYEDIRDRRGYVTRMYYRRIRAHLIMRVSLIDLTTGRVVAGPLIEKRDSVENRAQNAAPEAPSEDAALTKIYEQAVDEVSRMIFPWTEVKSVVLYDDKQCGLNSIASQLKSGEFAPAADASQAAINDKCGKPGDTNLLAKAYYNMGIALAYSDRPREGLEALRQSRTLRQTGITDEAIAAVQQVLSQNAQRAQLEAKAITMGAPSAATPTKAEGPALTNKDVIDMVRAALSETVIVNQIRSSSCKFQTSTQSLIALKQAGATDAVILAVTEAAANRCK